MSEEWVLVSVGLVHGERVEKWELREKEKPPAAEKVLVAASVGKRNFTYASERRPYPDLAIFFFAFLALALGGLGCGPMEHASVLGVAPVDTTGWPGGPTVELGRGHRATLWTDDPATTSAIEVSLHYWVETFEAEHGELPPTEFGVLVDGVPAVDSSGRCWSYRGRWCGGKYVLVAATPDLTCPGAGHELLHRTYALPDHQHPSPEQWLEWLRREEQLLGYLEQWRGR